MDPLIQTGTRLAVPTSTDVQAITLTAMTPAYAEQLGEMMAQIKPWLSYNYDPEHLTSYFALSEPGAPRFAIILANSPEVAIGALGLRENWLRGPYIQFLGLDAHYHSRGIGTLVLNHIQSQAIQLGAQNLWVMASEMNDRALIFYQRFGFHRVAEIPALVVQNKTEILLRKPLT